MEAGPTGGNCAPVAVSCAGLRKSFGATGAVAGVDLQVPRGRVVAVLGPSGCGKTTLLRLIAGFERPDSGHVALHGRVVASPTAFVAPERRRVGMVFQEHALFPHLDVEGNVGFGLRRLPRAARARRVATVLELVGLTGLEHRMPSELSGGQQQRVALARALAPEPTVILFDEPFSNLDAGLRASLRVEVRAILTGAGATAVFVTHDQEEALSLADEVAVMGAGRIHQLADPHTLYTRPADRFVATFVGDADVLRAERVGPGAVVTALGRLATATPVGATHVEVVVRPENLRLRVDAAGAARVESATYFGHDQVVRLRLDDGTSVRARLGPDVVLSVGDRVSVAVEGPVVALDGGTAAASPSG